MANYAQSVRGPISKSALGRTLMHEHILCDLRDPAERDVQIDAPDINFENRFEIDYFQNRDPRNMLLDNDDIAIRELELFRDAGGQTIVELTVGGLCPRPDELKEISEATGTNIVVGAGFYVEAYLDQKTCETTIGEFEQALRDQLGKGLWGTEVRAGLIGEIGCSWPLAPCEERLLKAAARVQASTGVAITIHPGRHPDAPVQIANLLMKIGAEPSRTIIGHMDRTIFDRERLLTLLRQGFVLEWDFFGIETSHYWMAGADLDLPTDYMRLDLIHSLMRAGHAAQIAISQDICTRTRLRSYGGHGYGHLFRHVVPMMRRRGWSEGEIEQLIIETPARLLCYLS
ncbi:MAG: aryldialkylphosphatase [Pseudomonadota bacterium]